MLFFLSRTAVPRTLDEHDFQGGFGCCFLQKVSPCYTLVMLLLQASAQGAHTTYVSDGEHLLVTIYWAIVRPASLLPISAPANLSWV